MNERPERYHLIDALRGFLILNMIAYHLCFDVFVLFRGDVSWIRLWGVFCWERFICCGFILLSGACLHFSRRPFRRAAIVLLSSALITAATFLFVPDLVIWFGILGLIGVSMLLTALLRPLLEKIPAIVGAFISFLLFAFSYGVPDRYLGFCSVKLIALPDALYRFDALAVLGFRSKTFFSSDYFPLLPWFFLFLTGWFLFAALLKTNAMKEENTPLKNALRFKLPALSFLGRHSLLIYLLHQPVLYGLCCLFFEVMFPSLGVS